MATSAFKSTTRRAPIGNSSPSTDDSPTSSSSKSHRRSRSLSRFSRPIPAEFEPGVVPTPRRKFVNTVRGSDFSEISLDDLAIEFFSGKDNSSEVDDESVSSRSSRPVRVKSEISPASSQRRSRSVSRHPNGDNSAVYSSGSATASTQRRGRSVSRRNDGNGTGSNAGGAIRVVPNADSRRRRSVSVARHQISDTESDIDLSRSSASQLKSRSMNNGNSQVASFQRPTASSHRRLTRSMSQAPQLRSHDDYSSQSFALTDDDLRDARYGRKEIEKTIRAVYAQKKIDHPTGDDANLGLCEAMKKELRSAVNEIMIELEQNMERKPSALSVHDRLYSKKSDATPRKNYPTKLKQLEKHKQDLSAERALEEQRVQDGFKIVREVLPESNSNVNAQRVSYSRKRSNDRNRVSKRLNEEAEKYFEDFISNVEDTDFSSFDGERSDTSSSLVGTTVKQRDGALPTQNGNIISLPVEMEGINLPWLKWDDNDGVSPTTPKTKLWDPSQDLKIIQEHGNRSSSSHGSWNPEHTSANSTNAREDKIKETKSSRFDMGKYFELKRTEELLFDSWRERSVINSGGLFLCSVIAPS
ncbi:hypothetical protein L1987_48094 [Smallanthus sonchifolius]|uniref:Uncharacterized protein n=1 Tax=Smallanthus sonchifolius TaxID=185202 RepID=A0ACB9FQN7_9ASTR|nr:hypothetical protein L1987_48094 [Smallanthus sonchifolius]